MSESDAGGEFGLLFERGRVSERVLALERGLVFKSVWCSSVFGVQECLVFKSVWCSRVFGVRACLVFERVWCSSVFGVRAWFVVGEWLVFERVWCSSVVCRWRVVGVRERCDLKPDCLPIAER